jgi:hypothetical protein
LATASAAAQGVTAATSQKSNTAWKRWIQFLHSIGLPDDPFLDNFDRGQRHRLLGTFAQSVRHCTYSKSTKGYPELVAGTCITAVNGVAEAFKAAKDYDPRLDSDGKTSFLLQRLYKGYKNLDPSETQQKSLSLDVIRRMIERVVAHPALNAFHELVHVAFFFAMRSCEYLEVNEERRTDAIIVGNIIFRRHHRVLPHSSLMLALADTVSIIFVFQKRTERNDQVTQRRTGHSFLCPVRAAAKLVKRIRAIPGTTDATPVYTYMREDGKPGNVTNKAGLKYLRDFIKTIDHKGIGIDDPDDIGLHSIRSSTAMAMYINEVPVYTIMLLGRWSSDAFLRYIRKQVEEFGEDVSRRMIRTQVFHHVGDANRDDPRNGRNPLSFTRNTGMGRAGQDTHNSFSVW